MAKSVAFKCTYNDGGEDILVGFSGICSRDNIELNVENSRVWCSSPDCPCKQYYDKGMKGSKPKKPCYESRLFQNWQYGAGYYHTGKKAGTPIHLNQTDVGKFAFLTTRFPGEPESERRIVGLFQIGEVDNSYETIVSATPESRIRLPLEEAKELYYWAYLTTKTGKPDWRTRLFRYLEDGPVHRVLADVATTVRDEGTKAKINRLITEVFGDEEPPPAVGCLPERSVQRPSNVGRRRKYGMGGEGEAHQNLKNWIAKHPDKIGLSGVTDVDIEHRFLSGDLADIVFTHGNGQYTVVEVETIDPFPGAHQAIKYRALLCTQEGLSLDSNQVKAVLVAWSIPYEVQDFCNKYGIEYQVHKL